MARVLIVEDDEPLLEAMYEILELDGHEVRKAESGEAALHVLKDWRPEIIVTDVIMPPGISGIQLAEAVRVHPRWKDIPILFVSGSTSLEAEGRINEITRSAFLRKPFSLEQLQQAVLELLESGEE